LISDSKAASAKDAALFFLEEKSHPASTVGSPEWLVFSG
jgi:hypothetical protein